MAGYTDNRINCRLLGLFTFILKDNVLHDTWLWKLKCQAKIPTKLSFTQYRIRFRTDTKLLHIRCSSNDTNCSHGTKPIRYVTNYHFRSVAFHNRNARKVCRKVVPSVKQTALSAMGKGARETACFEINNRSYLSVLVPSAASLEFTGAGKPLN